MMRTHILKSRGSQAGLASVEVALVLPFLLVMMLLATEFTRVFYDYNTLTKGVRDAARFAAERAFIGSTGVFNLSAEKSSEARNLVVFGNVTGAGSPLLDDLDVGDVSVTQVNLGSAPQVREHVQVTVNYLYRPFVIPAMGFLPQDVGTGFTLTASSTMRGL